MKLPSITSFVAVFGLIAASSQAYAGVKVAEFGDSVTGNSYRNCTWTPTYSTGGQGYEYREYKVVCPASGGIPAVDIKAGISFNSSMNVWAPTTCQTYVPSGYYAQVQTCSKSTPNWRIYKN